MKRILVHESPCMECGEPKVYKEYVSKEEEHDMYRVNYASYFVNNCTKCGKIYSKLV